MKKHRYAFTMIELLFVIVVLGIVGGIALEAVRQYYEGIYKTQIYSQRINEADQILEKLSKYFENAIDISIVNLDKNAADNALNGHCEGHPEPGDAADYTVGFVGVDVDSLYAGGWSEDAPIPFDGATLTPGNGANLSIADTVIKDYYPASDLANSVIYNVEGAIGSCSDFHWDQNGTLSAYYTITAFNGVNTLTLTNNYPVANPLNIKKYLIRSGYAFRVLNTGKFMMYTNFRPWKTNEKYSNGQQILLGQNVASFYADFDRTNSFTEGLDDRGTIWRLKVCMRGVESNLSTTDRALNAICRERKVRVRF